MNLLYKRSTYIFSALVAAFTITGCVGLTIAPDPYEVRLPYRAENGLYGYIDSESLLVIPAIYSNAVAFSEGRAAVLDPNTKLWGYINQQGRWITKPEFTSAESFDNGVAKAFIRHRATRTHWISLNPFSHDGYTAGYRINLAGTILEKWTSPGYGYLSPQEKAKKQEQRKKIVPAGTKFQCSFIDRQPADYLLTYQIKDSKKIFGVFNRQCQEVVPFGAFQDYKQQVNEFFVANLKDQGWGIFNAAQHTAVIPFIHPSREDVKILKMSRSAPVFAMRNATQQWQLFDTGGKLMCGHFNDIKLANDNAIAVQNELGLWGAISANGSWIVEPRYAQAFKFTNYAEGHAVARVKLETPMLAEEQALRTMRKTGDNDPYYISFYIDKHGRELRENGQTSRLSGSSCNK